MVAALLALASSWNTGGWRNTEEEEKEKKIKPKSGGGGAHAGVTR